MSLSAAQVRVLANTEPFRGALAELVRAVNDAMPALQALRWRVQRQRSRAVTRRKRRYR